MMEFALGCIAFLLMLAVLAAIADWIDEPRRDARRRNHARRIR